MMAPWCCKWARAVLFCSWYLKNLSAKGVERERDRERDRVCVCVCVDENLCM